MDLASIEGGLRRGLAVGFDPPEDAVARVVEELSDEYEEAEVRAAAGAMLPRLLAEREAAMASWPAVTDCDRLDRAFEELNARGILARQHWTCCFTCGMGEMEREYERLGGRVPGDAGSAGVAIVGHAFYHEQDTARAAEGGDLFVAFGVFGDRTDERTVMVGRMVCDALTRHGLAVEWDADAGRRIAVRVDWKKRPAAGAPPTRRGAGSRHTTSADGRPESPRVDSSGEPWWDMWFPPGDAGLSTM